MAEETKFSDLDRDETAVVILSVEHMLERTEANTPQIESRDMPMHERFLKALRSALGKLRGGSALH